MYELLNITITVPGDLRERMRRMKGVNWSEVARKAFEEEIKKIERIKAAEEIDELRKESKIKWNGVEEIRR